MDVSDYGTGDAVEMVCFRVGCEEEDPLAVTLGMEEEHPIHPDFVSSGRFRWEKGTPIRIFRLEESRRCPGCNARVERAAIVRLSENAEPIVFSRGFEGSS